MVPVSPGGRRRSAGRRRRRRPRPRRRASRVRAGGRSPRRRRPRRRPTTSSTQRRTSGRVSSPGRLMAMPSAIVGRASAVTGTPARSGRGTARRPRPARRRLDGRPRLLDDDRDPADQPAAADGDDHVARSGTSSSSSRPSVAWPATRAGRRTGGRTWRRSGPRARARRHAVVDGVAAEVDDAAEAAQAATLAIGARRHEDLARDPARAGGVGDGLGVVARAAGDDAGAAVGRASSLSSAPRSLKEPVR